MRGKKSLEVRKPQAFTYASLITVKSHYSDHLGSSILSVSTETHVFFLYILHMMPIILTKSIPQIIT